MLVAAGLAMAGAACGRAETLSSRPAAPAATPTIVRPSATSPTPVAPAVPAAPRFSGTISVIDAATRARMSSSWRPGCPVGLDDLRLLRLSFWGFDAAAHSGEIVVHRAVAAGVVTVFRKLFDARFPIRRMRLVDVYGGDDGRSMAANNTSGFNCRRSTGDARAWSEHSYGRAIDINPIQNPYVPGRGPVEPDAGAAYADRSSRALGVIHAGDVVVRAFRSIGWEWGGDWNRSKDYQHFSESGR